MNKFWTFQIFLVCLIGLSMFSTGFAEENESIEETGREGSVYKMDEVVVSATKTEIKKRETGTSLSIITEEDIKKRGKKKIVDLLREVPGLSVVQNGKFGGASTVYVRGSKNDSLLVLIDGIRTNDSTGIGKNFDFANLDTLNIERIEVIRGPQSSLYGSDALGGVINIITKKGRDKTKAEISFEAGSFHTFSESFTLAGGSKKVNYSFGISRTDTEGVSQVDKPDSATRNYDKDAYNNTTLSSRLNVALPYNSKLDVSLRYNDSFTELDDGAFDDDRNYEGKTRILNTNTKLSQEIFPWWNHHLSFGYSYTHRKYLDETDPVEPSEFINSWYEGTYKKIEWQNNFPLHKIDTITAGIEYSVETGSSLAYSDYGYGAENTEFNNKKAYSTGYYIHNHLKLMKRIYHTVGFRLDDHKEFGTKGSYQTSISLIAPITETQLKASLGSGFKAPSIYQLYAPATTYGPIGNEDLKPEKNYSWDTGFEQPLFDDRIVFGATYFSTIYKDMIDFEYGSGYKNIGRVESRGIEAELFLQLPFKLSLKANYTYTNAEDKEQDEKLLRRPEHQACINLNWNIDKKANVNLGITYMDERKDVYYDEFFNSYDVKTDSYVTMDLYASYWITSFLQLYGRVDNLTNKKYETIYGYNTPGRAWYGGVKGSF